ncbi:MAG TPA: DinB family protein [Pyrinomonadaceae bacterium]
MNLTEYLLEQLNREVERSRRAVLEVPSGKYDWKPHEKSMILGYLADMVATIPTWIVMEINQDELDVAPEGGSNFEREKHETSESLVKALDEAAASARAAFEATTDEHLKTNWKLLARGNVVMEAPRYEMIQDTFAHWSHHRGQLTVYLRLLGAKVPALFGPSADDQRFDL